MVDKKRIVVSLEISPKLDARIEACAKQLAESKAFIMRLALDLGVRDFEAGGDDIVKIIELHLVKTNRKRDQ